MTTATVDYAPRGPHRDLFRAFSRAATRPGSPPPPAEVLVEGPAGTAKSRNILEIIHFLAETIEGPKPWRCLLLRKTRVSLNDSVLFTLEDEVWGPGHAMLNGASREHRSRYVYPNKNQLVLGGMDNVTKLFSTQYDLIYINEADELALEEYESLFRALRNFAVPWQSIISDCNPNAPGHFLNQRPEIPGSAMKRVRTRHRDNPMLFLPDGVTKTAKGEVYMRTLDQLTGVRRLRLRDGIWAAAEGQIYENFDPAVHVIDAGPVDSNDTLRPWGSNLPAFSWYMLSQDYGFRDAQVLQLWGVTEDRRAYRIRERYRTHTGLLWWTDTAVDWIRQSDAIRMVCDHRPELIQMLNDRLGYRGGHDQAPLAIPANKGPGSIESGIDLVREMLGNEQGLPPRIFFVREGRDPLRDPVLLKDHMPTCTEDEIPAYVWLEHRPGQPPKNRPDPSCQDHGADAMRYAMLYIFRNDHAEPPANRKWHPDSNAAWYGHDEVVDEW